MGKSELWSYYKAKSLDKKGRRWHFVQRYCFGVEPRPFEMYFRDEERTEFGLLRFENTKDFPYRNSEVAMNKIMNNDPFRRSLLDADTEAVWKKNWK